MTDSLSAVLDAAGFREQFPVFERLSYLNAGTTGPVPRQAAEAVHRRIDLEAGDGRCGRPYFEALMGQADRLREAYAELLACEASDVALTGSTTDGVNTVLSGLDLRAGEEILTSDEEHPGLLAPLARAKLREGVTIRAVPFGEIAGEVTTRTRLVACSHVSWASGQVVDVEALATSGVPVLLDAAQALGAIPVDVKSLGCAFYAASGQKWLCGPEGSGCLFVAPEHLEELLMPWPGYGSLADPAHPLESEPAEGAKRFDHGFPTGMRSAWALASLDALRRNGWEWLHERGTSLAAQLARSLADRGVEVIPRGHSTLVSWRADDVEAEVERLSAQGFVVRHIAAFGLVRASVGAWSSEEELEELARIASG